MDTTDKVIKAVPLDDDRIEILTSSGISGIFDVKPYLGGSVFQELHDESYFRTVRPAHGGIAWPHEQDFCADTIIWDMQREFGWIKEIWFRPGVQIWHMGL
uniref:DUF2442 domain-containing protein n=1 Tax=Candidatus Kentrum sp. LFY TaxID=2126342 RepID=A0A450U6H8_9GAMM|nr:MAG: Protein of unknown function (DUF2442) [Candidatus Kentron sp. LFY]